MTSYTVRLRKSTGLVYMPITVRTVVSMANDFPIDLVPAAPAR